jgi:hypothetical protein
MDFFKPTLEATLDARFSDPEYPDELKDICIHGMSAGFSGFIYSSDLYDFFERYEDEIEDMLDDADIALSQLVSRDETWTLQEIREKATWAAVELYAYKKTNNLEEYHA